MQLAFFFAVSALLAVTGSALLHHKEPDDEPTLATLTPKNAFRATRLLGHQLVHLKAEASTRRVQGRRREKYGPEQCVSVWRDSGSGKCLMETDCKETVDLSIYEFGLMCIDEDDKAIRHIFGMNSFKHKEKFNTLIKCKECRALREYMDTDKALKQLYGEVSEMNTDVTRINKDITALNAKAGIAGASGAPAPKKEEKPKKAAPAPAKFLLGAEPTRGQDTQKSTVVNMKVSQKKTSTEAFKAMDKNGDGVLSYHEATGKSDGTVEAKSDADQESEQKGEEAGEQDGEEQSVEEVEQSQESSSEEEGHEQSQESESEGGEEEQPEESDSEEVSEAEESN